MPTSQHAHGVVSSSQPSSHKQTKFVFICRDSHRSTFQRPYEGPFKVLQSGDKTFTVNVSGRNETISVDRLKPAHIDPEQSLLLPELVHRGRLQKKPNPSPTATQAPTPIPPPPPQPSTASYKIWSAGQPTVTLHLRSEGSSVATLPERTENEMNWCIN